MERFSWDFHVRDDSAPPQTHTLGSKPSSSWQVSGLPERAFSRSWGPVPSPKTPWRKGSGSLQTPGTTRANEDGEIRTPGKGRDDPTRAPTAWGSGARRSRRPHLRTEAGASPSPAQRPAPCLPSPEPAPGYEPDVGVASDERLQVPPDVVFVSLAQYVSHARDSLAQPRGLGALRRRGRGGPPSPSAPFPPPPAAPRLVPGLALLQPPPRPHQDRLRPRGRGHGPGSGFLFPPHDTAKRSLSVSAQVGEPRSRGEGLPGIRRGVGDQRPR